MSATVLYNNAVKQTHVLQQELERLESGEDTSSGLQGQITAGLASLQRGAHDLDEFARREVTAAKKEKAIARAKKVREDFASLQIAFTRWKTEDRARTAERDRKDLLGSHVERRTSFGARHGHGASDPRATDNTILMMDHMIRENGVLENSGHRLDEFMQMGRAALQDLVEQRDSLKGTQRRLLDVANYLGLSTSVIRYIERRTAADRWIFLGGVTTTVFIMWLIVHYLG
ncbi:snare region anchored in the vesicle membrane C-terminus-domain-containing protein [Fimicolochytrium jonesii]|uniref:snare region anchored in the vesicle membrane C-terminus-domain-containing protein n=1 Tax=Fimicolochytrium jonesii TaxID=1396493 RepID=UPI0022FE9F8F|nr:snare region anchored in the vesicle membrane C-terminus-domain-containing protein [Fimicolochytrium jonesii]KAI8822514.1 snare region anchored in the vesicle membrane C-terminus-domain-containing protein [Fimicolochytrium jonesii]